MGIKQNTDRILYFLQYLSLDRKITMQFLSWSLCCVTEILRTRQFKIPGRWNLDHYVKVQVYVLTNNQVG